MKHIKTFESFLNEAYVDTFKKGDGVKVTGNDGPDIKIGYEGVVVDGEVKKKGGKEYIEVEITGEGRPYKVDIETSMLHITSTTFSGGSGTKINLQDLWKEARMEDENEIKSESRNIIGKTTKIGNIEVAEKDLPKKYTWERATELVSLLGNGWRLPTVAELQAIAPESKSLGMGEQGPFYWSSEEKNAQKALWINVKYPRSPLDDNKDIVKYSVRAVNG
jgi:hypothetical protein